jgi:hypothetical protein
MPYVFLFLEMSWFFVDPLTDRGIKKSRPIQLPSADIVHTRRRAKIIGVSLKHEWPSRWSLSPVEGGGGEGSFLCGELTLPQQ